MNEEELKTKYSYASASKAMQQYLDIKIKHYDSMVLFRMGDFYELFYSDAAKASKILNIALTKRAKANGYDIPMCGIPFHALNNYLNKLILAGLTVVISEQTETPQEAKRRGGSSAVVNREVTRIVTPGTIIEEGLISASAPNYLASVVIQKNLAYICYSDISTSEIYLTMICENDLINELAKLAPKEILLADCYRSSETARLIGLQSNNNITYQVDNFFSFAKCEKIILNYYKIKSTISIGDLSEAAASAIGSIIEYLIITQKSKLPLLPLPKIIDNKGSLTIDLASRRNLEIITSLNAGNDGSLLKIIDKTISKPGARLLHRFISTPLAVKDEIDARLNTTEFFYSAMDLTKIIRNILKSTVDLERTLTRVATGRSFARDLLGVKETLDAALRIKSLFLNRYGAELPAHISNLLTPMTGFDSISTLINEAIKDDAANNFSDGNIIKEDYHPKVKELRDLINNGNVHIEKLRQKYQSETSVDNLKIVHNNILGLFIEVTTRNASKINDPKFIHRQTTLNSVRYTTSELQYLESNIINAKSLIVALELQLYEEICQKIVEAFPILRMISNALSHLDLFCNLAHIANEYNYVKPIMSDDYIFEVNHGRHALVEQSLNRLSQKFVPNDCNLSQGSKVWLLTGPNMAGKSTFLRQNALIVILAQIGSFVPAESASIGIVDKIFSRIGSGDDLMKGYSTFMVEMLETSAILAQSTNRSLIILDEIGRGTSTYDGVAIAWSVLEHIHNNLNCRCLFATHYHELTSLNNSLVNLKNYTVEIEENDEDIVFMHKILPGSTDRSYGIHVAKLAGLPKIVIARAKEILQDLESKVTSKKTMEKNKIDSAPRDLITENILDKYQVLIAEINAISPDNLSPKQALELIYQLKKLA